MARVTIAGMGSLGQEVPVYDGQGNIVDYTQGSDSVDVDPVFMGPTLPSGATSTGTASAQDKVWLASPSGGSGVTPLQIASPGVPNVPTSSITSALSNLFSTAPSPRVSTATTPSLLTSSSILSGIPDILTIGIGVVALVLLTSGKKRR